MTENRSYALVFQAAETGSREGEGERQTIAALVAASFSLYSFRSSRERRGEERTVEDRDEDA